MQLVLNDLTDVIFDNDDSRYARNQWQPTNQELRPEIAPGQLTQFEFEMELGCDKVRSLSWNWAIAKLLRIALSDFNQCFKEGFVKTPLFFPLLPPASVRCINPPLSY